MTEKPLKPHKKSTIIVEGSAKPKASKVRHYVDNEAFYNALVERREQIRKNAEAGLPPPKITNFIGECIVKIATRMGTMHYFRNYPYLSDIIGNAIEQCIVKIDMFDPNVTKNPFSYFTQTCYFVFIGTIGEEKKEEYIRYRHLLDAYMDPELSQYVSATSETPDTNAADNSSLDVTHIEQYVGAFEEKHNIRAKKEKRGRKEKTKPDLIEQLFT